MAKNFNRHISPKIISILIVAFLLLLLLASASFSGYRIAVNYTSSLPATFFLLTPNKTIKKGEIVYFRWWGGYGYDTNSLFIKKILGVSGDLINLDDNRHVLINREFVSVANGSEKWKDLTPIENQIIGEKKIFVGTHHAKGLDSRYSQVGLIDESKIIGSAYPLF